MCISFDSVFQTRLASLIIVAALMVQMIFIIYLLKEQNKKEKHIEEYSWDNKKDLKDLCQHNKFFSLVIIKIVKYLLLAILLMTCIVIINYGTLSYF